MSNEVQIKWDRIRAWLSQHEYDGLLLTSQASFSWLTGGRGFISVASENSCAKIFVTQEKMFLITNNIEKERLITEEIVDFPCEIRVYDWFDESGEQKVIQSCIGTQRVVYEKDILKEMILLRQPLTEQEQNRYYRLGRDTAFAIEEACRNLKRGYTEFRVSSLISKYCMELGIEPIVNLVAADGRIFDYRHPLPTNRSVDQYVLLVLGGRRNGLVASVSRLVYFGNIPEELQRRHKAVTEVDAVFISKSRPGARVGDIFQAACERYKEHGFKDEWKFHHQGGMTGYVSREYRATPQSQEVVGVDQAFAWNPSISGVKSEDTILVKENTNEVLTRTGNFPEVEININGQTIKRPDILRRNWCGLSTRVARDQKNGNE
jgi:Xaa-Pro aminopeptidase